MMAFFNASVDNYLLNMKDRSSENPWENSLKETRCFFFQAPKTEKNTSRAMGACECVEVKHGEAVCDF